MKLKTLLVSGVVTFGVLACWNQASTSGSTNLTPIRVPEIIETKAEIKEAKAFMIEELSTKNAAVIQLNTVVTEASVNDVITKIKKANKDNKKVIYLLLDSPGGSVFDGSRLITTMESSKVPVNTICTEGCYSMASQILEHGVKRYMIDRATLMFHPASTTLMEQGEVDKLYSRLGYAKRFIDKFDMYVAKRSGQTYNDFKAKTSQEYYLDSAEALEAHLIDGIVSIDFEKEVIPDLVFGNKIKQDMKDFSWIKNGQN